jgi:hypothetical protein
MFESCEFGIFVMISSSAVIEGRTDEYSDESCHVTYDRHNLNLPRTTVLSQPTLSTVPVVPAKIY